MYYPLRVLRVGYTPLNPSEYADGYRKKVMMQTDQIEYIQYKLHIELIIVCNVCTSYTYVHTYIDG